MCTNKIIALLWGLVFVMVAPMVLLFFALDPTPADVAEEAREVALMQASANAKNACMLAIQSHLKHPGTLTDVHRNAELVGTIWTVHVQYQAANDYGNLRHDRKTCKIDGATVTVLN